MGTNYYLHPKLPDRLSHLRHYMTLHIGKSSAGWCFSLRIYPGDEDYEQEPGPLTLGDWKELFNRDDMEIRDEYGQVISTEQMLQRIESRVWYGEGGLRRHPMDGRTCVAHGEGTWDLCVGEFS